jgi:pyrroline-5-carboxylate reductase
MFNNKTIAIVGGGNLGISIAEGLIHSGLIKPQNITVTRRKVELLEPLQKLGINTLSDNKLAVAQSEIIILAVKPKQTKDVLIEISKEVDPSRHIIISVVTGVTIKEMLAAIEKDLTIFRAMPNTAIAIQQSMTCIASYKASKDQQELVLSIFNKLGKALMIEEELMEASTVLGACGIAYALRFIRAASQGGIEIGFDANTAQIIAAQTAKGAAALLIERGHHPEREIDKVTTPQGCTIAGLNELEHNGFSSALIKGIMTSFRKIAKIH